MNLISYSSGSNLSKRIKKNIWKILLEVDKEFIPPLSSRTTTTDNKWDNTLLNNTPKKYYSSLITQDFFLVKNESGNVIGFLSYIPNFELKNLGRPFNCHYISTLIVENENRGQGIAKELYKAIIGHFRFHDTNITTRTWSGNIGHTKILKELKFDKILELHNDRNNNISTLYFNRIIKKTIPNKV